MGARTTVHCTVIGLLIVAALSSSLPDANRKPQGLCVFRRGDIADAEPALPGWHVPVDDLFG